MKNAKYFFIAALISILLHVVLIVNADKIRFAIKNSGSLEEEKVEVKTRIKSVNLRDRFNQSYKDAQDEKMRKEVLSAAEANKAIRSIFRDNKLIKRPKPKLSLTGLGKNVMKQQKPKRAEARKAMAPRPEIVKVESSKVAAHRLGESRNYIADASRQVIAEESMVPSLVDVGGLQSAAGGNYGVSMRLTMPGFSSLKVGDLPPEDYGEYGEAGFGGARTALNPRLAPPALPSIGSLSTGGRKDQVKQLDTLMTVRMSVQPSPDGSGFFRIDISPNPQSDEMRSVPKDILFLIDSSGSISPAKLKQFKDSTVEALEYLSPTDRFSVVNFTDKPVALFEGYVTATTANIKLAQERIKSIQHGGMTDIFAGLSPFVKTNPDEMDRPLNIFLMSDGQSTVKDKMQNDRLIREIFNLNRANVSIYSFSAGDSANLFLLDFLAYHNRGRSLHVETLEQFKKQLVGFISTHADLIVKDLKYHVTNVSDAEIFPKRLQHLYRGETLSVFGKFPAGCKEVAVSIVGENAQGDLEELIFRGDIKNSYNAGASLGLDWAAQKYFHLLGLRTLTPDPAIDLQIRQLSEKYSIFNQYVY